MQQSTRNQIGFTIVEILIAMSAISVSSVGLLWSISAVRGNNMRMQLVANVTDLESAVVNELMNKANYTPSVVEKLKAGNIPEMSFTLNPAGSPTSHPQLRLGRPLTLTRELTPCANYGSGTCGIRMEVQMRRLSDYGRSYFAYAYRISTQDSEVSFRYSGAGAQQSAQGGFSNEEFKLIIPYDYYLQNMQIACQGGNNLALNGIDVGTGKATCIKQPLASDKCADGTLPKRIEYINDEEGGRIAFVCGPSIKSASCGGRDNYLLHDIDTTSLDGDTRNSNSKNGRCVFAGRNPATTTYPLAPITAKRISGQACPPGYKSQSTCRYVNVRAVAGVCPWCYGSAPNCSASTVLETPPGSGTYTRTTRYFCSDTTGKPQPAEASQSPRFSQNTIRSGYVDCRVHRPQQDCGATWDADVQLSITCVMDGSSNTPEFINVQ